MSQMQVRPQRSSQRSSIREDWRQRTSSRTSSFPKSPSTPYGMFRSLPAVPQKPDVRLAVADQIPDYTILICDKGDVQQQHFAYVHTHLFYIFLELVKNAARASIERVQTSADRNGGRAEIPSMNVTVPEEVGIWDHERSVKLADRGTGMNRSVLGKAFSYFYSSVKARPTVAAEVSDFDRRMPLAGFGFGLPISRVMARYFAGDVDVNSIPGQGTDVYIYL
eukprot:s1126_g1.t1